MLKQYFDDYTGDVLTPRGLIHFENGVLIINKKEHHKNSKRTKTKHKTKYNNYVKE